MSQVKRQMHQMLMLALALLFITNDASAANLEWTSKASMPTERTSLAAVATADGKIYAIGGLQFDQNGNPTALTSTEEYNIVTNTWAAKSGMSTGRFGFGAAMGSNGKIYAIGGNNMSTVVSIVEEYDVATNTWTNSAPMPTARMDLEVVATDSGDIYAIGGIGSESVTVTTVEKYDPATNTWTTKASLPTATSAGRGAVYVDGGKIYVFGPPNTGMVQVYDIVVDNWSTVASMPDMRWYMGNALAVDGNIYTIGGYTDTRPGGSFFGALATVEKYDPATNTWTTDTSLPTPRFNLAAVSGSDGKLYALGGDSFTSTSGNGEALSTVEAAQVTVPTPPEITTTMLASGVVGTAYNQELQAIGGVAPLTWSVLVGSMPSGMTLNSSTGVISGTPTTVGTYNFTVQVSDTESLIDTQELSIAVYPILSITTTSLSSTTVTASYSQDVSITGGMTPFTWEVSSGSLPDGLSLNMSTGAITGISTIAGTFNFTIRVSSADGQSDTEVVNIVVNAEPSITTTMLPGATVTGLYSQMLAVAGGSMPLTWSLASGALPAGLSLNSTTGVISGTPMNTGTSNFIARATDTHGVTDTQALAIVVNAAPIITTTVLPTNKKVGVVYPATTVGVANGTTPLTWSVSAGTFPPGLLLNASTGVISGIPTSIGTYNFTVQASDANGVSDTQVFTIKIHN